MSLISPYIHTCTIPSGPLQGNEHIQLVHPWDVQFNNTCDVCNKPLVSQTELLAHIYEQLLKE
jgi:hypothetical protein